MVSDRQAGKVIELMQSELTKAIAAAKAGMDEKTARKWVRLGNLALAQAVPIASLSLSG